MRSIVAMCAFICSVYFVWLFLSSFSAWNTIFFLIKNVLFFLFRILSFFVEIIEVLFTFAYWERIRKMMALSCCMQLNDMTSIEVWRGFSSFLWGVFLCAKTEEDRKRPANVGNGRK